MITSACVNEWQDAYNQRRIDEETQAKEAAFAQTAKERLAKEKECKAKERECKAKERERKAKERERKAKEALAAELAHLRETLVTRGDG